MAGDRDITLDPTGGGIFLFLSLACGVLARVVLSATGLPYTVILLLLGALFGALDGTFEYGNRSLRSSPSVVSTLTCRAVVLCSVPLGSLSDSIHTWANLDPHMILYIFLPGLIFGSAFAFGAYALRPPALFAPCHTMWLPLNRLPHLQERDVADDAACWPRRRAVVDADRHFRQIRLPLRMGLVHGVDFRLDDERDRPRGRCGSTARAWSVQAFVLAH